jgi:hypothetical protein
MGMLPAPKTTTPVSSKRKSGTVDFSKLQPLKSASTVKNFAGYRDANAEKHSVLRKLVKKRKDDDDMDSDGDGDDLIEGSSKRDVEPSDDKDVDVNKLLSPEDAERQKDLAEGVKKINLVSSSCTNKLCHIPNSFAAQTASLYRSASSTFAIDTS